MEPVRTKGVELLNRFWTIFRWKRQWEQLMDEVDATTENIISMRLESEKLINWLDTRDELEHILELKGKEIQF